MLELKELVWKIPDGDTIIDGISCRLDSRLTVITNVAARGFKQALGVRHAQRQYVLHRRLLYRLPEAAYEPAGGHVVLRRVFLDVYLPVVVLVEVVRGSVYLAERSAIAAALGKAAVDHDEHMPEHQRQQFLVILAAQLQFLYHLAVQPLDIRR